MAVPSPGEAGSVHRQGGGIPTNGGQEEKYKASIVAKFSGKGWFRSYQAHAHLKHEFPGRQRLWDLKTTAQRLREIPGVEVRVVRPKQVREYSIPDPANPKP